MALRLIYNASNPAFSLSVRVLGDGGDAQRVESIPSDTIPVALTAGNASFTVSTTTITLSSKLPSNGEEYVFIEATIADITWWDDGKDPGTTPGHILSAGYGMFVTKSQFSNYKFRRAGSTDAGALLSAYKFV
jgi:hypothetical protein